jgi:predicted  nucleic acid-binding Zn-ribbon protein
MYQPQTTYNDLMDSLDRIPADIGDAEQERVTLRQNISRMEQAIEERRITVILGAGGWASLGKNEGEREIVLKDKLRTDEAYRELDADLYTAKSELAELDQFIISSERQYGAICYKAKLTAAFMAYVAGATTLAASPTEAMGL